MRTAHRITRTGYARARGEHLVAANEACLHCTNSCNEGRDCPGSTWASAGALAYLTKTLGPYVAAVAAALLLAAAPVVLDGQGPQQEISR